MAAAVLKMAALEGVSEGVAAADAGVSAVAAVREALPKGARAVLLAAA